MIGVYGITVNGMLVYIGKSIDLVSRRKQHWKAIFSAKDGKEKEIKYQCLAAAMDKHFSIEFKIIEECEVDILEDRETYYIQEYIPILNSRKTGHDIDITIDDFLREIETENISFIKECNKNVLFLKSILSFTLILFFSFLYINMKINSNNFFNFVLHLLKLFIYFNS